MLEINARYRNYSTGYHPLRHIGTSCFVLARKFCGEVTGNFVVFRRWSFGWICPFSPLRMGFGPFFRPFFIAPTRAQFL